jgi:hypothetical protein
MGEFQVAAGATAAFINLGGHIQYIYRFSDGSPYLSLNINKCRAAELNHQSEQPDKRKDRQ